MKDVLLQTFPLQSYGLRKPHAKLHRLLRLMIQMSYNNEKKIRNRTIANVFLWNFEVAHKTVYLYGRKKRRKESYNYRKMQERI